MGHAQLRSFEVSAGWMKAHSLIEDHRAGQDHPSEEPDPHQDAPLLGGGERLQLVFGGRGVERSLENDAQLVGEDQGHSAPNQHRDEDLDDTPPELLEMGED